MGWDYIIGQESYKLDSLINVASYMKQSPQTRRVMDTIILNHSMPDCAICRLKQCFECGQKASDMGSYWGLSGQPHSSRYLCTFPTSLCFMGGILFPLWSSRRCQGYKKSIGNVIEWIPVVSGITTGLESVAPDFSWLALWPGRVT